MTMFPSGPVADGGDLLAALGGCAVLDCRVRVVRVGGWSWGPDPAALARGAIALLPGLLAAHLTGARDRTGAPLLPGAPGLSGQVTAADREVTEPVHIRSAVTLDELLAAAGPSDGTVPGTAVRHADVPVLRAVAIVGTEGAAPSRPDTATRAHEPVAPDHHRVLVGLLADAAACGALDAVLAGLPQHALALLLRALDAAGGRTPLTALTALTTRTVSGAARAVPEAVRPVAPDSATGQPPDPLALTAAVLAALRCAPSDRRDVTDTDTGPAPDPGPSSDPAHGRTSPPRPAAQGPSGAARSPGSGPVPGTVVDTDRALPFLLLPPLQDRGWLTALDAVLAGGGAPEDDATAFAACLAHKVLPAPAHGWLRSPQDAHAVAVFAGLWPTTAGPDAVDVSPGDLERRVGPLLPLLDSRLGLRTAREHTVERPVLLHAVAPERLLLLDVDGLYPVWEARQPADLLRPWELAGSPLVLLPARPAPAAVAGLTPALDALGVGFVTDLPPSRGERLSRVPGPRRCWANAPAFTARSGDAVAWAARRLAHEASRAARFVEELVDLRPAVHTGGAPAVECSTTLAAGVALADLAWQLWSDREVPDPVAALDRFADLGARVTVHDTAVEIRLPLGPRHADLHRHRLLADVPDVPWFGGRTVVFTGG